MRRQTKVVLLVMLGLALAPLVLLVPTAQPTHAGKPLKEWLAQLDYSYRPSDIQASNAVYLMGTNVLPFLRPMLEARDSHLRFTLYRLLSKQGFVKFDYTPAEELRRRASRACRVIGPPAAIFLPELTSMLDSTDPGTAWCGLTAILGIEPGAQRIPELTKALTNVSPQVRRSAVGHLRTRGEHAHPAVPAVIKCLEDADLEVRASALRTLARIRPDEGVLLPALISGLNDPVPAVRRAAILALGEIGIDAEPVRAKLETCLGDEDRSVRAAARHALDKMSKATP